jgi:hypothetical protein
VLFGAALQRHSLECKAINLSHKSEQWNCTDVGAPIPRAGSRSYYAGSHAVLVEPDMPPSPCSAGSQSPSLPPATQRSGLIEPRGKSGQLHHRRADLPGNSQSRWAGAGG